MQGHQCCSLSSLSPQSSRRGPGPGHASTTGRPGSSASRSCGTNGSATNSRTCSWQRSRCAHPQGHSQGHPQAHSQAHSQGVTDGQTRYHSEPPQQRPPPVCTLLLKLEDNINFCIRFSLSIELMNSFRYQDILMDMIIHL